MGEDDSSEDDSSERVQRSAWTETQAERETEIGSLPGLAQSRRDASPSVAIEQVPRNRPHGSAALVRWSLLVTEAEAGSPERQK